MIDIKELSVGNWAKFPHGIDKIVDLPYIEGKGMCASFAASATLFPVSVENLEPIEITPEILEKNGCEINISDIKPKKWIAFFGENASITHGCGLDEDKMFAIINSDKGEIRLEIRYVHQLQNILTLCGINKEIELL